MLCIFTENGHLSCFLFGHSIFVWWNRHAWHFGILSILKIQPYRPPKTCSQLHDHSIAQLSPSTSIYLKPYSYLDMRSMPLTNLIEATSVETTKAEDFTVLSKALFSVEGVVMLWDLLAVTERVEMSSSSVHCSSFCTSTMIQRTLSQISAYHRERVTWCFKKPVHSWSFLF